MAWITRAEALALALASAANAAALDAALGASASFLPPAAPRSARAAFGRAPIPPIDGRAGAGAGDAAADVAAAGAASDPRRRRPGRASAPLSALRMGLLGGMFGGGDSSSSSPSAAASAVGVSSEVKGTVKVGDLVGSGSYGTVHLCTIDDGDSPDEMYVAKRPWSYEELSERARDAREGEAGYEKGGEAAPTTATGETWMESDEKVKERAGRCRYYMDVEGHCLAKLGGRTRDGGDAGGKASVPGFAGDCIPDLRGTYKDGEGREWLVFGLVTRASDADPADSSSSSPSPRPAITLSDAMDLDWADQHAQDPSAGSEQHHHLYVVQKELGLPEDSTFADTLDAVLLGLLRCNVACHVGNVVHRDVKPQNLLCDPSTGGFVLIDFGSAADMDPTKGGVFGGKRVGLEDGTRVALSPIYAAPETFVRPGRSPLNFDSFSSALVFCQLLFNLLEERTDAAFHQQLELAGWDLDSWLDREMAKTLRFGGLDDAVGYLGERPGLWALLRDMLNPDPERRSSSSSALRRFEDIMSGVESGKSPTVRDADGAFFASVLESCDVCEIPEEREAAGEVARAAAAAAAAVEVEEEEAEAAMITPRPLHFVASFDRSRPLGLVLSEADGGEDDDENDDEEARAAWEGRTASARPGEVFVRGIAPNGQADKMGIFEIGDRLQAVGELPVGDGGFERAVEMIKRQPRSAKTVRLHFDRESVRRSHAYERAEPHLAKVVGHGAWSSLGRRKAQEDAFVLNEIHDEKDNAVLMAGIFDGHGGRAASTTVSQMLPGLFAAELASAASGGPGGGGAATSSDLRSALLSAWDISCDAYRSRCDGGTCVADYDPREGIILADTGSKDLIAGTTATAAVLSVAAGGADEMTVLNCGDSRTLVLGWLRGAPEDGRARHESVVHFSTRDHNPSCPLEAERLRRGEGMGYSQPKCSMSRYWVPVGDYRYAVSRSLEGPFATSKGVVSEPDVTTIDLPSVLSEREGGVVLMASDGMFDVMDNEQVGREILRMREKGIAADEAAKDLCRMALEKGTSDNVSVVVVYLD